MQVARDDILLFISYTDKENIGTLTSHPFTTWQNVQPTVNNLSAYSSVGIVIVVQLWG